MSVDVKESIGSPVTGRGGPVLDVVVPVYNEERDLARCVRTLHQHLR
ncbi:MAG TPA: glycosyltransferase, partial [Pseudonocardiaceae bacterium]|nr:glycosyltransferase [Pseudonocardiaceae bacterium]